MSGHIANTGLYSIVSIATGIGFIGLGKIGQFLKSNGSVVSAGLLTALATAAAVPLTKKGIVYLPPEVYQNKLLQNYPRHKADPILKALGSGALSFIITTLLINKLTYFISSYHLSLPKKIGVGLLSGGLSFLGFSLIMSKIEIEKQKQKASHQSVEQLHLSITETAHLQNLDERDRLFKQLESSHQKLACLTNGYSLESPPAQTRIETFNESIGTSDAAVYAMFFDQIEDQELQKALLAVFDQTPFYDQRGERITREAIEASMRKSSMVDTSLTKEDGIAAGISGALTLAATSAIITIMILTSRLAHWTWNRIWHRKNSYK